MIALSATDLDSPAAQAKVHSAAINSDQAILRLVHSVSASTAFLPASNSLADAHRSEIERELERKMDLVLERKFGQREEAHRAAIDAH